MKKPTRNQLIIALSCIGFSTVSFGQLLPVLVKNINPTTNIASTMGSESIQYKNRLFFSANNGTHGMELWVTDGTDVGTQMVLDLNSGAMNSSPHNFLIFKDTLFFTATTGLGDELWATDGTSLGTFLVKDINPGASAASPNNFIEMGNSLYFVATNGANGRELWKTTGAKQGATMVFDINPSGDGNPDGLTVFNNKLFFYAYNGVNGGELWTSDGTSAQTFMLKDINATGDSNPGYFTSYKNMLYFFANNSVDGNELWRTDGTIANTQMFLDINPGAASSDPWHLNLVNSKLLFVANNGINDRELWSTDGTIANTQMVMDINTAGTFDGYFFTIYKNKLFFRAKNATDGLELWVSDGTNAGTSMVLDINVGAGNGFPDGLNIFNNKLYFYANDGGGNHGGELWTSDGTPAGTNMVKDINPTGDSNPGTFKIFNNTLYFIAQDGVNGFHVWKSSGTAGGTAIVAPSICQNVNPLAAGSSIFAVLNNNMLLFQGNYMIEENRELYKIAISQSGIEEEVAVNNSVNLYPNPVSNELTVELSSYESPTFLTVTDLSGKLIYETQLDNMTQKIITADWQNGVYLFTIYSESSRQVKKIIVSH